MSGPKNPRCCEPPVGNHNIVDMYVNIQKRIAGSASAEFWAKIAEHSACGARGSLAEAGLDTAKQIFFRHLTSTCLELNLIVSSVRQFIVAVFPCYWRTLRRRRKELRGRDRGSDSCTTANWCCLSPVVQLNQCTNLRVQLNQCTNLEPLF